MSDRQARKKALDVSRSFIVQAPAGSGKTELLIQRYLALLPTVEEPEQIIAITFTRKAAAEMRGRVLESLRNATAGKMPTESHQQTTHRLALQALTRDKEKDWNLIKQPQRLRINTLDALNVWLAQKLPLLSGGVAGASLLETSAQELYSLAAQRVLYQLGDLTPVGKALEEVFRYANVSVERLEDLLSQLLPTRDQWLGYLMTGDENELVENLEGALHRLIEDEIHILERSLPHKISDELVSLLQDASLNADKSSLDKFVPWQNLNNLPSADWRHLKAWQAISELLLTKKGHWRKQAGFASKHADVQRRLLDLLTSLCDAEDFRLALLEVRALPSAEIETAQREVLSALRSVLHYLVGELKLLFVERNTVDFVELALAAQKALGDPEAPSELLLTLDQRLHHVLVDEFQDTSHTQLRLLELLTAGWEQKDGRTLFLVGDPMQSIYRFRNADMSLFLNTRHHGIGDIRCEALVLERNFRSRPAIISWINETFAMVFPQTDDLKTGAASFSPCEATRDPSSHQCVEIHALRGTDPAEEIKCVADIVRKEHSHSSTRTIAILVQSRRHLEGLDEQLRELDLPVHAVQIDVPKHQQIIQDLIGLTRALTHRGDRIAWLGILRAPWCGLTWQDLHELCWDDEKSSLWALMNESAKVARLSPDGQNRLLRTRGVLQLAFQSRASQSLARWVKRTWMSLEGPACLDYSDELDQADRFFLTLSAYETNGDLDDPIQLEQRFADPRIGADAPRASGIEIMTIHSAKGLQFDTVILHGLGRVPPTDRGKGMYWLDRLNTDGVTDTLLAPLVKNSQKHDLLTEWLKRMDRLKDLSERARLLYVATTRARERLHLVGHLPLNKMPPSRSLLSYLWPCVSHAFEQVDGEEKDIEKQQNVMINSTLRRLDEPAQAPAWAHVEPDVEPRPEFEWASQTALQVGTVVHRWLHLMGEEGEKHWDVERITASADQFRAELDLLGVEKRDLSIATTRVLKALQSILEDSKGRWVLADHAEAQSELAVSLVSKEGLEHLRLDRTFIDDRGVRWIIDYKTSIHEGGDIENFLNSEVERYRSQLDRYAIAMSKLEDRPARVGLYFPLLQAFKDWEPNLLS